MTTHKPPQYVLRVTRIHIVPEGRSIFDEQATSVEIVDEAAGEFISIKQDTGSPNLDREILIDSEDEWNAISAAVADLFSEIKKHEQTPVHPTTQPHP